MPTGWSPTPGSSGKFADLGESQVDFAPDGRTATVDLAMVGDFNSDRSKDSLALLRDDLAPALQDERAGRRGGRHR